MLTVRVEPTVVPTRGHRHLWVAGADQVVCSLGNFLVLFLVARTASAAVFGTFALVVAGYTLLVGLSRAVSNEPVSVMFAADRGLRSAGPLSAAAALGLAAGSLLVGVGLVSGGDLGRAAVVLGCCLPLLLVQDAARSVFVVLGAPGAALWNDLAWTAAAAGALVVGLDGGTGAGAAMAMWAAPGAVAGIWALVRLGVWPTVPAARAWERDHRVSIRTYATEMAGAAAARPVALLAVGAAAGVSASGDLQAAQVMFAPVVALHVCVPFVGYPEAARRRAHGTRASVIGLRVAGAGAAVVAMWAAIVVAAPGGAIMALFGNGAEQAMPLAAPTALFMAAVSVNLGALVVLRSERAFAASRRVRIVSSLGLVLTAGAGAAIDGSLGAAWAMAIWNVVASAAWWRAAWRSERG